MKSMVVLIHGIKMRNSTGWSSRYWATSILFQNLGTYHVTLPLPCLPWNNSTHEGPCQMIALWHWVPGAVRNKITFFINYPVCDIL